MANYLQVHHSGKVPMLLTKSGSGVGPGLSQMQLKKSLEQYHKIPKKMWWSVPD